MKKILNKLYTSIEAYFVDECSRDIGTESFFSAMKCFDNHEYEKALELYKIALKYEPNSDATYFNMGNVYLLQKDYDQALIHYKQASLLSQDCPNVNRQMAVVYYDQKKFDKALEYYLESEKRDKLDEKFYVEIGYCYSVLKDYQKSIDMYQKALKINPKIDYLFAYIASNYQFLGDYSQSILFYKKALTYEYNELTLSGLGYVYYLNGQDEESKALFSSLLEVNPNNDYALTMIYTLFYREKNYSEALNYLSKLLELESNNPIDYCNFFEMQLLLNRPFTKSLENQFIEKFKDDKKSFMIYSHLKILENITLEKEVDLGKWKDAYGGLDFENWELETLDAWGNNYKDEEIKVKLLEALQCFKENK